MCGLALVFPVSASAQEVLNGSISGLTLPMTMNGIPVTHLAKGPYTFSLVDNSGQHSIHMGGPIGAFGYTGLPVNFGTAGPDGVNVPATGTFVFDNVSLADGMYRWFCDRHSDMMFGTLTVGNYLSVEVTGRGTVSSFPVDFTCRSSCGVGVPDGSPPVKLTTTPARGYKFDHWEAGACSGNGDCSVSVNGLMKTRAVFVEIPAGSITGAKVTKARGKRTVTATLAMSDSATVTTEVRIGSRIVASKVGSLAAGTRTVKLQLPKSVKAGPATVRVTFTRPTTLKAFVSTLPIRLPKS